MRKKNYKFLSYLGLVLLMLPFGVVAMDNDTLMEPSFEHSASGENDVPMSALLSDESTFDETPPLPFDDGDLGLSDIPVYLAGPFLPSYSRQHDETADANAHSHSHFHSHSFTGGSSGSSSVAPNLIPALIVQQQMQQPETQTMQEQTNTTLNKSSISSPENESEKSEQALTQSSSESQELSAAVNSRSITHSHSHSFSGGFGGSVSLASAVSAGIPAGIIQGTMQQHTQANSRVPAQSEFLGQSAKKIMEDVVMQTEQYQRGDPNLTCPDPQCAREMRRCFLEQHIRTHTKEDYVKCLFCSKELSDIKILNKHMQTYHPDNQYKCGQCHKTFAENYGLQRHMSKHANNKPHRCVCGTAFKAKDNLQKHMDKFGCNEINKTEDKTTTSKRRANSGRVGQKRKSDGANGKDGQSNGDDSEYQLPASKKSRLKK